MTLIGDAAMEARCRSLVDAIELPHPVTLPGLAGAVAEWAGRDVRLEALPAEVGAGVSGMVVNTTAGYLVQYPHDADAWWALMCVSHELAHIICGHVPSKDQAISATTGAEGLDRTGQTHGDTSHINAWLPDMQDAITAWGKLYRCEMNGSVEQEAELAATLLVQRIERETTNPLGAAPRRRDGEVLGRFAQVLGGRRARRR